jgi:hypothetical protein
MTFGSRPSMTATTELVVPRSMPIVFFMMYSPSQSTVAVRGFPRDAAVQ